MCNPQFRYGAMTVLFLSGLLLCGCEKSDDEVVGSNTPPSGQVNPPGQGPAENDTDKRWKELVVILDDEKISARERLQRLEHFAQSQGGDHQHTPEMNKRLAEFRNRAEKEIDLAAKAKAEADMKAEEQQKAEAVKKKQQVEEDAKRKVLRETNVQAVAAGDLKPLMAGAAFTAADWFGVVTTDVQTITIKHEGVTQTVRRGSFFGLGGMRSAAHKAFREMVPATMVDQPGAPSTKNVLNGGFNAALRPVLGRALFVEPGRLDKKALTKLLSKIYIPPSTPFLGTTAQQVYPVVRPMVHQYLHVYRALKRGPPRARSVAALKEAISKAEATQGDEYQQLAVMMTFYREYSKQHVAQSVAANPGVKTSSLRIPTGFWLRRMADGTDKMLWKFARKAARDYDPELAAWMK